MNNPLGEDTGSYTAVSILVGSIIAISGAMGTALAELSIRRMKDEVHYSINPFYYYASGLFLSPVL